GSRLILRAWHEASTELSTSASPPENGRATARPCASTTWLRQTTAKSWDRAARLHNGSVQKTRRNRGQKIVVPQWLFLALIWHSAGSNWEAVMQKRAAIYVRVSTDKQTVENQVAALRQIADRRGSELAEKYPDAGISGAKGRDKRPGLDQMLKDASKRKFDVIMAWAIDRLGRSLIDLLGTIQTLEASGVDLYLD